MKDDLGLLLVGVGGQGVLTAARLLGLAALTAGHEARVGQLHGMAQRGGSLESTIVLGSGETAFVSDGEVDVLLAFEPLEAARALPRVSERTLALVNSTPVVPYTMTSRGEPYPPVDTLLADLRKRAGRVLVFDGSTVAFQVGAKRALNMVMLGALAEIAVLPFGPDVFEETIIAHGVAARRELTLAAFRAGRQAAAETWAYIITPENAKAAQPDEPDA